MKKLFFPVALLCAGCGDDKVQQQLKLLDQIEKNVTLTFQDEGSAGPELDGHFGSVLI